MSAPTASRCRSAAPPTCATRARPPQVTGASRGGRAAGTDGARAPCDAEAYRTAVGPRARGNARSIVLTAGAEQRGVAARARGDASRFQQVLDAYRLAPDITTQR